MLFDSKLTLCNISKICSGVADNRFLLLCQSAVGEGNQKLRTICIPMHKCVCSSSKVLFVVGMTSKALHKYN